MRAISVQNLEADLVLSLSKDEYARFLDYPRWA
jgi:hypothetical protein